MSNKDSSVGLEENDIFESMTSPKMFFEVTKYISRGGFGDVYRVKEQNNGKELIAKIPIIRNEKEDAYRNKKQKHEGDLLKLLKDNKIPNVAELYAFFESQINGNRVYVIIMEIALGVTLNKYIYDKNPSLLPENEVRKILLKLCEGLIDIHKLGYIHRDLKSENIFIEEKTNDFKITIIDFGISAFYNQASTVNTATQVGTPFYSPPEQFKGIISPSADVFAIGAIGFFLSTGGNNLTQNGEYSPKIHEKSGFEISKEFDDIIRTATWSEMSKRFPTIEDLMLSLSGHPPLHEMPRIIVDGKGIPITKDLVTIGRKMENSSVDIQVAELSQPNEHFIGREHCHIKKCDDGYYRLFDGDRTGKVSTNGTVWFNRLNQWIRLKENKGLILANQPVIIGLGYADKETGKNDMNGNPILPGVYKLIEYRPPGSN